MYRENKQHNAVQPPESIYKTRFSRLSKVFLLRRCTHLFMKPFSPQRLNGFLHAIALINEEVPLAFSFSIEKLPDRGGLMQDVTAYYQADTEAYLKENCKPAPPDQWHITLKPQPAAPHISLKQPLLGWFFHTQASEVLTQRTKDTLIAAFFSELESLSIAGVAYEILAIPPQGVYYAAHWQDFALPTKEGNWLLHLAVDD